MVMVQSATGDKSLTEMVDLTQEAEDVVMVQSATEEEKSLTKMVDLLLASTCRAVEHRTHALNDADLPTCMPWLDDEDEVIVQSAREGKSVTEMAELLPGRTHASLLQRIRWLSGCSKVGQLLLETKCILKNEGLYRFNLL